jgi:hypothetical protein
VRSKRRFTGFNANMKLEGTHAFLSASNYHWLNYSDDKLIERLATAEAAALGTELHETAARNIRRGIELKEDGRFPVLAAYVNDAISLEMVPEQLLFYSMNAYGTADAVSFEEYAQDADLAGFLRIHDFKSGVSKASFDQLYIYAGFFCLEYDFRPFEIDGELRIYQRDPIEVRSLDQEKLATVYDKIRTADAIIGDRQMGGMI